MCLEQNFGGISLKNFIEKDVLNKMKAFLGNDQRKILLLSLAGVSKHFYHLKFLIENKLNSYDREDVKDKILWSR